MTTPEEIKAQKDEAQRLADEANKKTAARIEVLKGYEGKTFKRKDGTMPNQTAKIVRYEGIGKKNGVLFHMFRVEYKNPGAILTPPATQFLEDYQEIEAKPEKISNEVI